MGWKPRYSRNSAWICRSPETSAAMCSSVWAAEICTRSRACPSGTTGNPKPITKTPSSSRRFYMAIAFAVSWTMIGQIAVGLSRTSKPASRMPARA